MAEYIEKDRLYKMVAEKEETARNWVIDTPTNSPAYMRYVAQLNERTTFKQIVADIPAADVRPVVEGKLVNPYIEEYYGEWYHCSVCGSGGLGPDDNFCPNCGADMREE